MTTVLLLQTTRGRDAADDAALIVAARELAPCSVLAATTEPERTARVTGLSAVRAQRGPLLRALTTVDALVVLGGRPLRPGLPADEVFPLPALYALATAFRVAGKRVALVGVGAEPVTGRHALVTRQLVTGSALTVLDSPSSAEHVAAAGVPSPIRVGADLAWLDLQDPPATRPTGNGPLRVLLGRAEVDAAGGAGPVAALLDGVLAPLHGPGDDPPTVAVHARCAGAGAGPDLDAAGEVVRAVTARAPQVRVETVPPAPSLADLRAQLASSALALGADRHALMAAAAAGVPTLGWPQDPAARATAAQLEVPTLPLPEELTPAVAGALVAAATARARTAHAAVRQQVATAGEVADLLRLLLTEGETSMGARTAGTGQVRSPRPTGVMR